MFRNSSRQIVAMVSILVLSILIFKPAAFAQSGAGSIQGIVEDAQSAVIPNCAIDVVNIATGVASHTFTNGTGFYQVPGLFVGTYRVTFTAKGMKKSQTTLEMQNGQVVTFNTQLQVGAVAEEVTVEATAVQLATYDSGTVNTELDIHRIDQLPENGRNVLTLASDTVPGLEQGGSRANGLMGAAMEYTQDGAPTTDRQFGGETANSATTANPISTVILPDPDSVQEVRFETVGSSAQFSTPATVELTTKSGTNSLHGSLFETARNNAVGIAKARQDPSNLVAPHYVRNEFGASVGGPIRIPKLYNGKDKSFFFFAYERYSLRQGTSTLTDVPTDAERNGDFSAIVVGGVQQAIYDPSTSTNAAGGYQRTQYAYNGKANTINPALISPLAKALWSSLPSASNQAIVPQSGTPNLTVSDPNSQTAPKYTFRLDHVFNDKNRAYVRFSYMPFSNFVANNPGAINNATSILPYGISASLGGAPTTNITTALQYSHIFSPTFFAETVVSQQWLASFYGNATYNGTDWESKLGLPNNFSRSGFPGITGMTNQWSGTQGEYGSNQIISNLDENLTKIAGKHQIQFGGRYRHERLGYLPTAVSDGNAFGTTATSLNSVSGCPTTNTCVATANTGIADASFFIGDADSYSTQKASPYGHYYDNAFAPYIQDNFHASHTLTLNLGLRWEAQFAPGNAGGLISFFDYKNDALVLPNPIASYISNGSTTQAIITNLQNIGAKIETASAAGLPASGSYNNLWNFNPRVGFAWTPGFLKHGTVIRGAFGEFLYPTPLRTGIQWYTTGVPFVASYQQSYISSAYAPDGLANYNGRAAQPEIAGSTSANVINTSTTNAILPGVGVTAMDLHYPPPHVQEYNLTIEQPLKDGSVIRASYIFTHGYDLDQDFTPNATPSAWVWVAKTQTAPITGALSGVAMNPYDHTTWGNSIVSTSTGWSNSNALQLNYQRPFKHGFAYQIFGVYSSAFRVGGNSFADTVLSPAADYLPGILPAGVDPGTLLQPSHALNRWENYNRDTAIPRYHVQYNGVVELPFGTGKHFLHNANRLVDEIVGGYQVAFTGMLVSQSTSIFSCYYYGSYCYKLGPSNYGATSPIKVYKNQKITDCRSGKCLSEYLWFNGYIPPSAITAGQVTGLPANYAADSAPIDNTPGSPLYGLNYEAEACTGCAGGYTFQNYVPGANGANPLSHTVIQGPKNGEADMSLYKVFKITEGTNLRINVDAFNVFNIQGLNLPSGADGTINFLSSFNTPRQLQFSGRFTF